MKLCPETIKTKDKLTPIAVHRPKNTVRCSRACISRAFMV